MDTHCTDIARGSGGRKFFLTGLERLDSPKSFSASFMLTPLRLGGIRLRFRTDVLHVEAVHLRILGQFRSG